jgi:hypothetical protein
MKKYSIAICVLLLQLQLRTRNEKAYVILVSDSLDGIMDVILTLKFMIAKRVEFKLNL